MSKLVSPKYVSRDCFFVIPMDSLSEKRLDVDFNILVLLNSMLPTMNTDGSIGLNINMKAKITEMLTVARGLFCRTVDRKSVGGGGRHSRFLLL